MKRARDGPTGATLWHTTDGGRLYEPQGASGYLFCVKCDAEGRDPYVGTSREIGFKPIKAVQA